MEKDIHFYLPKKGDWEIAKFIRFLAPKVKHTHWHWMENNPVGLQVMVCTKEDCSICKYIAEKDTLWIRLSKFCQDILIAFKELVSGKRKINP